MKNAPHVMDIPGGRTVTSPWLERAITDAPAFREKGLVLLRGVLPEEIADGDLPPRTQAQWGQKVVPYVVLRGNRPLAALLPELVDTQENEADPVCMGMPPSPEDPALAVPGLLQLTCPVGPEEHARDEGPVRTMLARLLMMPRWDHDPLASQLVKLSRRLRGDLLKLDLLREVWTQGHTLGLEPTQFGSDCGLVAVWHWNGEEVNQTVMCHPRSLPFLEDLAEEWLGERPGHSRRGPKPLRQRLGRLDDGLYGSPGNSEDWFLACQELSLEEVVTKEAARTLCQELGLSSEATWGEAGAAFYRRRRGWEPEQTQSRLALICPGSLEERRAG